MKAAGRKKDGLARREHQVPKQQRREGAQIDRVIGGNPDSSGARRRVLTTLLRHLGAGRHHPVDERSLPRLRPGEDRGERVGQGPGACGVAEDRDERVEFGDRELLEQQGRVFRGTHAGEHLEGGERAENLRLGPVIDVIP